MIRKIVLRRIFLGVAASVTCLTAVQIGISFFGSSEVADLEIDTLANVAEADSNYFYPGSVVSSDIEKNNLATFRKGDTLLDVLSSHGLSFDDSQEAIALIKQKFDVKDFRAGSKITVKTNKTNGRSATLQELSFRATPEKTVTLSRNNSGKLEVSEKLIEFKKEMHFAEGTIRGSLYESAIKAGLPAKSVAELIAMFSYDIDFQRQIKEGDKFEVAIEKFSSDEGHQRFGDVLYATLALRDDEYELYKYTDKQGNADYYDASGKSVRKALLRTPVNGARISSGFGMRKHPILGYSKMHRGVDFAAPSGTPIYAAGDGTVQFAGRKGGYGNYLMIKHNDKYATAYGHISRFADNARPGKRVKQGDIIAYVGSTGRSTGPHLHYEVLASGEQTNPMNVKFASGSKLAGKELLAFNDSKKKIQQFAASVSKTSKFASRNAGGNVSSN